MCFSHTRVGPKLGVEDAAFHGWSSSEYAALGTSVSLVCVEYLRSFNCCGFCEPPGLALSAAFGQPKLRKSPTPRFPFPPFFDGRNASCIALT